MEGEPALPELIRIGSREIRDAVDRVTALQAATRAFRALASDDAVVPPPLGIHLPEASGEVHVKGGWIRGSPVVAVKVATGFYRNDERGLPTGSGLVLILDAGTGFPLALLEDGGYLTELRTAAAGALAVGHLAPQALSRVAVVGTGVQARFQLRAIADVRSIGSVVAWSPGAAGRVRYAEEMGRTLGIEVRAAAGLEEAVRDAELIVTVTPSRKPLVMSRWVSEGATVLAVGSDGPGKQELEAALLARADKVVVDDVEQCSRLGELQHAVAGGLLGADEVYATLGEVVSGIRPGREGHELIVCDLTGVGAQDAAIAEAAWGALRHGLPSGIPDDVESGG